MSWGRHTVGQMSKAITRGLDDLFPRPWLEAWHDAQNDGWCPDAPDQYCTRCGCTIHATAQLARGCAFCVNHAFPWQSVTRLCEYGEPVSLWMHELKFRRQWPWANLLGEVLAARCEPPVDASRTLVCPVPLHPWRRIRRGYNQSQLIAQKLAKEHGLPLLPVLKRVKLRPPQSTLSLTARKQNVRHAFAMKPVDLTGWDVWLVDDVKTTGATTRACCRLLKRAGARRIDVKVIAVADPKGAHFQRK